MWRISLWSVRHYWALFAGTFVALALGVALIGVSASALAATWAVPASGGGPSVTLTDGTGTARTLSGGDVDMGGVQSVLAMAGVVSAFVTVFVIAGTCAFGIALRRRDMGLLRLVGAGGPQVRRMVLGESLAVAVPAALVGCALAAVSAPVAVEALDGTGLSPVALRPGPLVFAAGSGLLMAVLGMLAASRRAARVRPTEALREADLDARTMTAGRGVTGVLALVTGAVMVALAPGAGSEAATPLALFGTMALAVAATLLGPVAEHLPPHPQHRHLLPGAPPGGGPDGLPRSPLPPPPCHAGPPPGAPDLTTAPVAGRRWVGDRPRRPAPCCAMSCRPGQVTICAA